MWYTREEQSLLNALWYCMTGLQLMVRDPVSECPIVNPALIDLGGRSSCFWNIPLQWLCHQVMATSVPYPWTRDRHLGCVHRAISTGLSNEGQVLQR